MNETDTPLVGPPPAEVPLAKAPLVRVIAQVRFPIIASVEKREFISTFQESIRGEYPVLRPEQSRGVVLAPQVVVEARTSVVWRFYDKSGAWRVTLAPDFLALESTQYSNRGEFFERFKQALAALQEHFAPQVIDRLGVRYIDRLVGKDLSDLSTLVRSEVTGVLGTSLALHAKHAISENLFALPEESALLMARWGLVPAQSTVDPSAVEAISERSWLLDVDGFVAATRPFDLDSILAEGRTLAERIYAFFRWAVTDEFLKRFGGHP